LIAKKKKFQMRLRPIETGEMLYARAWFSVTCLITLSMVRNESTITAVVMSE